MADENGARQLLSEANLALLEQEEQRTAADSAAAAAAYFAEQERIAMFWRAVAEHEASTKQQLSVNYTSLNLYKPQPALGVLPCELWAAASSANGQFTLLERQYMQQLGIPEGDMLNLEKRTGACDAAHWTRSDASTAGSSEQPAELVRMEIEPDDEQRRRMRSRRHRRSQRYQR